MGKIKICVAGATGNVGSLIVKEIIQRDNFILISAISGKNAGENLGTLLNIPKLDLIVKGDVDELETAEVDVMIDYTTPYVVKKNVLKAVNKKINVVIGTSGLTIDDYKEIEKNALQNNVGVFAAGNFSITSALMQHFAKIAAGFINHWEIIDYAPDSKPDAPSGTSREIAFELSKINKPEWEINPESINGLVESRGAELNNSRVHSVRVPGFYSSSEVIFGLDGEKLTLRHDSISYKPYVTGTLLACEKVINFKGLKRGLNSIIDI